MLLVVFVSQVENIGKHWKSKIVTNCTYCIRWHLYQCTYFAGSSSDLGRNGSFAGVDYKFTEQNGFELRLKKNFVIFV